MLLDYIYGGIGMPEEKTATVGAEEVENQQGHQEDVETEEDVDQEEVEAEKLEMSKDEYEKALQKESDRRVTQALKKKEKEWEEKLKVEKEAAIKEAEKLAKMSEKERLKVQKEKEELEIEKARRTLEEDKAAFEREKLDLETHKQLAERNLPTEFAPYIQGQDADDIFERLNTFEKSWQKAIEEAVQDRLRAKSPKTSNTSGKKKPYFTREEVESMSRDEVRKNMEAIDESMTRW